MVVVVCVCVCVCVCVEVEVEVAVAVCWSQLGLPLLLLLARSSLSLGAIERVWGLTLGLARAGLGVRALWQEPRHLSQEGAPAHGTYR